MHANTKIKYLAAALVAVAALQAPVNKAEAYVSINVHIGAFPTLVPVPGYPVYYASDLDNNLFFYDGLYWLYVDDDWYSSAWYDGPWDWVGPFDVPVYVLRVPVRYYRRPPIYFRAWSYSAPPRWGEHWGRDWEYRRRGWDNWDRSHVPPPAPIPYYQRDYRGDRYPRGEQQRDLIQRNYRYEPGQQSGFRPRFDRDEGGNDRGGALRPAPNVTPMPRSHVGPDFGRRDDDRENGRNNGRDYDRRNQNRDDNRPPEINRPPEVNRPPVIAPQMNDRDRRNDRQENRQWSREAAPQRQPAVPREPPQPAQPRAPERSIGPAPNNERRAPLDNHGGFNGGQRGNHDRDQGRDRDRDKDR